MENNTTAPLTVPPQSQIDWLECLQTVKRRSLREEEWTQLCMGHCRDTASVVYLEDPIVEAVNAVLKRDIARFRRDMEMYGGDVDEMYMLFATLAKNLRHTLFFENLSFLREEFRTELAASVKKEVSAYWDGVLRSLREACMESGDIRLEDQLYMIRRIVLFTT